MQMSVVETFHLGMKLADSVKGVILEDVDPLAAGGLWLEVKPGMDAEGDRDAGPLTLEGSSTGTVKEDDCTGMDFVVI